MSRITQEYNLQVKNPILSKEWHPAKNNNLTPNDVTPMSGKKVWWVCDKGHEWEAAIHNRNNGKGCPYCSGRRACEDNCLQTVNPTLAMEWHPTKNESLTPHDVIPGSAKKVWWICSSGHEWKASIASRNIGAGCPYCSGRRACEDNCLQTVNPTLAMEWHPTKNGSLTPSDVTPGSGKKVWWICEKGHEWNVTIRNRNRGAGCPFCSRRVASDDNNLEAINPDLSKEWHPTKNVSLTPKDVTPYSHKKVWWICSRGHEWKTGVFERSRGTRCPYCYSQTSQLEIRIFTEMKYLFKTVEHRKKLYGIECDIYVPDLNFGIEIDGSYWHKDKYIQDLKKTQLLNKKGIILLRIRESGLKRISADDVFVSKKETGFSVLRKVGNNLLKQTTIVEAQRRIIKEYLKKGEFKNNAEYLKLLYMLPSPIAGNSLEECNKILALQWHYTKNGILTSRDVHPGSHKLVWWICEKGHEWKASIASRNIGAGCPYCTGQKASDDNCLQTANQSLASEWHPTKNGILTSRDVHPGSHKLVWWICEKGHEWKASIASRNIGAGCPYCSGRRACEDNCLQTVNPTLAMEWHPTKNGSLTPSDVTPGSGKKVWWICEKGHEWEASVKNRNRGSGCPYCVRQRE